MLALMASASVVFAQEKIILLNEGNWQTDNGRITYFENGVVKSNQWFRDINGFKLGDTPNDIIQINDNLIAIALNWSNIIQFITPQGVAVAATENVPNNRKLVSDGRYVYASSYGHECETVNGMEYFEKGYVAKIDTKTFEVVAATEVGYEPEGIALYKGHLFVANSGGYAFQEDHDYETTVSILNAETMEIVKEIDTGFINLYGKMSQSGKYLCINSAGDHYNVSSAAIIIDCDKALGNQHCFQALDIAANCSTTARDGSFIAIGSSFSYVTGDYKFNYATINPEEVMQSGGKSGVKEDCLPGTIVSDLKKMGMPYDFFVNPYTGYIYSTDAGSFASAGQMYQWNPEGKFIGKYKVYINPAHFLALPPDGHFPNIIQSPIEATGNKLQATGIYNLKGQRVTKDAKGVLIINGKKVIK